MQRNVDPLNMCHLFTINDININECISLTQNTLTFKQSGEDGQQNLADGATNF